MFLLKLPRDLEERRANRTLEISHTYLALKIQRRVRYVRVYRWKHDDKHEVVYRSRGVCINVNSTRVSYFHRSHTRAMQKR